VKLILEEKKKTLLVPKESVLGHSRETIVYVVEGDSARRRAVQTGLRLGGEVEIAAGLKTGETIVTMGQQRLHDGAKVIAEQEFRGVED
jgi:multidrug efflux pump subunit AcrA (membrane-fusion protein)